ncbi:nuclear valosin-containing protein-like [Trichogramma pretiosum]|uniref:nuclear valosin-containing protein-like n=1 Tax=Trichogramma pretiosum TaxID=7493 RepID=UPI0006C9C851|nr:nuclear valosin-containing protein-like [Trichogramma pretiosum]
MKNLIVTRVTSYLSENPDLFVDINDMADALQKKYRDFKGKKKGPFRILVRQAYNEITESMTRNDSFIDETNNESVVEIESNKQVSTMSTDYLPVYKSKTPDNECTQEITQASKKARLSISANNNNANEEPILLDVTMENGSTTPVKPFQQSGIEKLKKKPKRKDEESAIQDILLKKKPKLAPVVIPEVKFKDIGGNTEILKKFSDFMIHVKQPKLYAELGISPLRGILLYGPPGCGKTLLANAFAGELETPLLKVATTELIAGVSGESEQRIRELFDQATAIAPCILFLDDIDAIAPHREAAQREMEKRIVSQLLSCLDELSKTENGNKVLVVGATNRLDAIDPALRRTGRFDREVSLGFPDKEAREAILKVHLSGVKISPKVSLEEIAFSTPGFVGADLVTLIKEAGSAAVNRVFHDLKKKQELKESDDYILSKLENDKTNSNSAIQSNNNVAENSMLPMESSVDKLHEESSSLNATEITTEASVNESTEVTSNSLSKTENIMSSDIKNSPAAAIKGLSKNDSINKNDDFLSWLLNVPELTAEQLEAIFIEEEDFKIALKNVQPSAKRKGFATVPNVTWDDVGSLQDVRSELQRSILAPVKFGKQYVSFGFKTSMGILLCGPPGCGKTLLAKAIANQTGINFISVKGPELLNKYVGESERAVRDCFAKARDSAPCVIFFDELDALCPKRSEGDNSSTSRVVNQLLTEMDGVEGRSEVFILAASNRPDIIDSAVLRPGRLDKILYVGLPNPEDRFDILRVLTKNGTKPKLAADVNLKTIAEDERCSRYTGADLAAFVREACLEKMDEIISGTCTLAEVSASHFESAFSKIRPSVSEKDLKHYEKLRKLYSVDSKKPQTTLTSVKPDIPSQSRMECMDI